MIENPSNDVDRDQGICADDWSEDISEFAWLAAAAVNPVFDFLDSPVEDVYSLDVGVAK